MTVLLGVSMGAHAVRMALPRGGAAVATRVVPSDPPQPLFFKNQVIDTVDDEVEYLAAESISAVAAESEPYLSTGVAYRDARQADTLHRALENQHLQNYSLIHEVEAVIEYLVASGEAAGHSTVALYDLGSSGLNVSVVDLRARRVVASSRSTEFSGDLFDDVLRDNQLDRLGKPSDDADIELFERRCRVAKERLSSNDAVCLPDASGMILLSRDSFESLIGDTVDRSIEFARDVLISAHVPIDAVVLIGGGSRIPLVRERVGRSLDLPAITPNEPESVAARGAALSARSTAAPAVERPRPPARPIPVRAPREGAPQRSPRPTDATPTISIAREDLPRLQEAMSVTQQVPAVPAVSGEPPTGGAPVAPEPVPETSSAPAKSAHFALSNVYWLDADFDDSDGENDEERKRRLVRGWSVAGVAAAAVVAAGAFLFTQQNDAPVVQTSVTNTQTEAPAATSAPAPTTSAPAATSEVPVVLPPPPAPAPTTTVEEPAPAPAPQVVPDTSDAVTQPAPTQEAPTQQSPQQPAPAPAPPAPLIPGLPDFTLPVLPPLFPPAP